MSIALSIRRRRVRSFFAKAHWGLAYGQANSKTAFHHGRDIIHTAHTLVPSPVAGEVVRWYDSKYIGRCIVVKLPNGHFVGVAHCTRRTPVGKKVQLGSRLAVVAGPRDFHGTQWTGPHSHFTYGTTIDSVLGIHTVNPDGILNEALLVATGKES